MAGTLKTALIYNPVAGRKRYFLSLFRKLPTQLEIIKIALSKYDIPADYFQTQSATHTPYLAQQLVAKGYKRVIVAGGDGTISEVAQELVETDATLAIIPTGSFINIPHILGIPDDIDAAVKLIQSGHIQKIDMGKVTVLSGKKIEHPHYFLESVSIGLEAQLQEKFTQLEQGDLRAIFGIIRTWIDYYLYRVNIKLDKDKEIKTRVSIVTASNAPYLGASIPIAPKAELTDHKLTVRLFRMSRIDLIIYFLTLMYFKRENRRIQTLQGESVTIKTKLPRLVQIDARIFGTTPVECSIVPNALKVICQIPNTSLHKQ